MSEEENEQPLVERLRWSDGWFFENPWDHVTYASDDPFEAADEIERLREELAAAYVKLSGRTEHASDCATSNAPAKDPGPCDCGPPDDLARAINVELGMARSANDDASAEWISGFHFAWKRVKAVLGDMK